MTAFYIATLMTVFGLQTKVPLVQKPKLTEMAGYLKDGRMKSKEDVVVGLQTFPETLLKLFNGENFGKLVLEVAKG